MPCLRARKRKAARKDTAQWWKTVYTSIVQLERLQVKLEDRKWLLKEHSPGLSRPLSRDEA